LGVNIVEMALNTITIALHQVRSKSKVGKPNTSKSFEVSKPKFTFKIYTSTEDYMPPENVVLKPRFGYCYIQGNILAWLTT
jgi:hypothetical protein